MIIFLTSKLSVPSITISEFLIITSTCEGVVIFSVYFFINISGCLLFKKLSIALTFKTPISFVEKLICLCKFVSSTTSKSTKLIFFMPDEAMYVERRLPNPPKPKMVTSDAFSFC